MKNIIHRWRLMKTLVDIFGKTNVTRWQSKLKYVLSFRNCYSANVLQEEKLKSVIGGGKTYVFIIDGRTRHGGLSDRLRGMFSVFSYCQQKGFDFKVLWNYPFNLGDYFLPAEVDWVIKPNEMIYDKRVVDFKFFNSYSFLNDDENTYFILLDSPKPIVHVYSNVTINEDKYKFYFESLFKPAFTLEKLIQENLSKINGSFVSVSFRFIGLLGDFVDRPDLYPELESSELKKEYINKCTEAIERIRLKHSDVSKVLVTSDSAMFLESIKDIPYVYIVPGSIAHIDEQGNEKEDSNLKTFLDFLLVSKAQCSYYYSYGRMFAATKFAKTAALIDGRNVIKFE